MGFQANRDQGRARYRLRSTEASAGDFVYDEERLLITASPTAAEFQVSRAFSLGTAELRVFKVLIAADSQIIGWRQGRQLGVISFLAPAAKLNGAKFDGAFVTHGGVGLAPRGYRISLFSSFSRSGGFPV